MPDARMNRKVKRICVYCGSGSGEDTVFVTAARTLGRALATSGIGLVFGGGSIGLMGEVAQATLQTGGHVTGVIPEFLKQRELALDGISELIVTSSMHERKQLMFEKSDAFVALPGGVGTLEELVEQLTWAQLGQHSKPIVLLNINDFWQPLLTLFDHMRAENFIRAGLQVAPAVVASAEEIVPVILDLAADREKAVSESSIPAKF